MACFSKQSRNTLFVCWSYFYQQTILSPFHIESPALVQCYISLERFKRSARMGYRNAICLAKCAFTIPRVHIIAFVTRPINVYQGLMGLIANKIRKHVRFARLCLQTSPSDRRIVWFIRTINPRHCQRLWSTLKRYQYFTVKLTKQHNAHTIYKQMFKLQIPLGTYIFKWEAELYFLVICKKRLIQNGNIACIFRTLCIFVNLW